MAQEILSVVICTRNRAALLPGLLHSLNQMTPPRVRSVEIIHVDNDSTDETGRLLAQGVACSKLTSRVVLEKQPGISNARNRGLAEARGEYVIFLDDDALPCAGLLRAYEDALEQYAPDAAGGPIIPHTNLPTPRWFNPELPAYNHYLVRYHRGAETKWLNGSAGVWGANMAYRRRAALDAGGFDPNLGVRGDARLGGEEADLQQRILKRLGGRVLYVHDARVLHLISAEKMQFRYLLCQQFARGVSNNRVVSNLGCARAARETLQSGGSATLKLLRGKVCESAAAAAKAAWYAGHLADAWRTWRSSPAPVAARANGSQSKP